MKHDYGLQMVFFTVRMVEKMNPEVKGAKKREAAVDMVMDNIEEAAQMRRQELPRKGGVAEAVGELVDAAVRFYNELKYFEHRADKEKK